AAGVSLLRVVSCNRLGVGVFCVHARAARALEFAVVVVPAAVLLPPSDVLRDDQVSGDGDPWAGGWLGQTRTQSHGRSGAMIESFTQRRKGRRKDANYNLNSSLRLRVFLCAFA